MPAKLKLIEMKGLLPNRLSEKKLGFIGTCVSQKKIFGTHMNYATWQEILLDSLSPYSDRIYAKSIIVSSIMKRNLCTILAVLTAAPGYAASLNPADWEVIENAAPPSSCFTFGDGNLYATGNSNGKELFYKVKEGTNLMVNGSGLTITLQFNNAAFLADESTRTVIEVNEDGVEQELEERRATEFHINFHNDNSDADGGGDNYFHSVRVYNSGDEQLNIYGSGSQDDYFTLDSSADSITTIKVNYTIIAPAIKEYCLDSTTN